MQQRYVPVGGYKTRYIEAGNSGDVLLLVHGLGASAERWEFVIPLFAKHFRVIAPDLLGFGHSEKPSLDYTVDFFTDFLEGFLTEMGIDRCVVMGSSMGGQVCAEFTAKNNACVKSLILVSPSGTMTASTVALDAYTNAALYPGYGFARVAFEAMGSGPGKIPDRIVNDFVSRMKMPNAKLAYISALLGIKNAPDVRSALREIRVPTLLIWGSADPVIPPNHAGKFVSAIPDCTYQPMVGFGHTPYVDDPKGFYRCVMEFLQGPGGASSGLAHDRMSPHRQRSP